MKKFLFMLAAVAMLAVACDPDKKGGNTLEVKVSLELNDAALVKEGVTVGLKDMNTATTYEVKTDAQGIATFKVLAGLYEAVVSFKEGNYLYNGLTSNMNVAVGATNTFVVKLAESVSSPLLIKEAYFGGCPKDDTGTFQNDGYVILYNNSDQIVDASNVCFAYAVGNAHAVTSLMGALFPNGEMQYDKRENLIGTIGWVPATQAVWSFNSTVTIQPYSQIVVVLFGAIDHTQTHSNSVNLKNSSYYVMLDKENGKFTNAKYAADESIPTSNYLKAAVYDSGNAWLLSVSSPGLFIFLKENGYEWAANPDNRNTETNEESAMVPMDWVIDGIDVFARGKEDKSKKRIPATIDSGNVWFTNTKGYSVYRNVDKEATEAIEGNKAKLVYGYAGGTKDANVEGGTTDPSGINAEASIKNGAKIVYKDTNNSGNDFHERVYASLTGK